VSLAMDYILFVLQCFSQSIRNNLVPMDWFWSTLWLLLVASIYEDGGHVAYREVAKEGPSQRFIYTWKCDCESQSRCLNQGVRILLHGPTTHVVIVV
jgi:hypothetical protein